MAMQGYNVHTVKVAVPDQQAPHSALPHACPTPLLPLLFSPPPLCSMTEFDGTCSLRLRTPCEWDGVLYEAVSAVQPVPLLSGGWPACVWGGRGARRPRRTRFTLLLNKTKHAPLGHVTPRRTGSLPAFLARPPACLSPPGLQC